jgi:hypothetical protein
MRLSDAKKRQDKAPPAGNRDGLGKRRNAVMALLGNALRVIT